MFGLKARKARLDREATIEALRQARLVQMGRYADALKRKDTRDQHLTAEALRVATMRLLRMEVGR